MERIAIRCLSCRQGWLSVKPAQSVYEQQAQESCPCPRCGAYTLCCADDERPSAGRDLGPAR